MALRGGSGVEHVSAPEVADVVDTTGAGDAFVGALAYRLREGDGVAASARFAVRAASISVTRPGTIRAFATLDDVRVPA